MNRIDWAPIWAFLLAYYAVTVPMDTYGDTMDQMARRFRRKYDQIKGHVKGMPPDYLFGPVWTVLYGLLATATFLYWRDHDNDGNYDSGIVCFLITWIFLRVWSPVFFTFGLVFPALLIIILLQATAIALLVFTAEADAWISFAFVLVYLVWLVYAGYLNLGVIHHLRHAKDDDGELDELMEEELNQLNTSDVVVSDELTELAPTAPMSKKKKTKTKAKSYVK